MRRILRANNFPVFLLRRLVRRRLMRMRRYLRKSDRRLRTKRLSLRCSFVLRRLLLTRRRLSCPFALIFLRMVFFVGFRTLGTCRLLKILLSLRRILILLLRRFRPLSFSNLRTSFRANRCFLRGKEERTFRSFFVIPLKRRLHLPPNRLNFRLSLRMRL